MTTISLYLYRLKLISGKLLTRFLYVVFSPLAYFYTPEKEKKRYQKKLDRITENQAITWMAEDIARYMMRYPKSREHILICDYANEEHFGYAHILNYNCSLFKRKKTRMAKHKFKMSTEFQLKIMERLKQIKGIQVEEKVETFTWQSIKNYQKTCIISIR